MTLDVYRCPRTGRPLSFGAEAIEVVGDGRRYPIAGGVPVFSERPVPAPRALAGLAAAVEAEPRIGWRAALELVLGAGSPELDYVTHERFLPLLDLLPITPDTRVLEVGASLGQQTVALARRTPHLHALELLEPQARLTRARCVAEGLGHVSVAVGGDDARLPYADGAFDLAVLNLVLEWCGAHREEPHEVVQARLLSSLHRVLAPGGTLFVGTKSRFALHLLFGARDEHLAGLRFGSALPRFVARGLLALFGVARAPGHLVSRRALTRMLTRAGFEVIDPWLALPHALRPARYVHADARSIREAIAALDPALFGATPGSSRVLRRLPVAWIPGLSPGLCVLARKRA